MKKYLATILLLAASGVVVLPAGAASLGSSRPEAQQNYIRLVKTKSCPGCDLAGVVLTRMDLKGADLEGANLAGAKLVLADLTGANLKNANLQGAALGGADLANCNLRGANLTGAILEGAYLDTAEFDGTITSVAYNAGEDEISTGEKVYVPAESKSKPVPYTQETATQETAEPAGAAALSGESASTDKVSTSSEEVMSHSKTMTPIATAVVPEKALTGNKAETGKEDAIETTVQVLEDNPKTQVKATEESSTEDLLAKSKLPVKEQEQSASVSTSQAVELETQQVEKDTQPKVPVPVGTETTSPAAEPPATAEDLEINFIDSAVIEKQAGIEVEETQTEVFPVIESDAPKAATIEEVMAAAPSEAKTPPVIQDAQKVDEGTSPQQEEVVEEEAASTVSDMIAMVEQEANVAPQASSAPVYSVETPQQAIARQQKTIEEMLDNDRCVECDLTGADISGKNLKGADLERIILTNAKLSGVDFREANLKGAVFQGADLRDADFREADLYRADFSGADLTGARFEEALIDSADFTGAVGLVLGEEQTDK